MIHDYMRQSRIGRSGFSKLKGHLRIELKDSRGRAVKTIEGDNMITDALKDIFAANYCGAMDYRKFLPLYSKMLGGVLCFGSNTLDVTSEGAAKDYFIPDNSTHPVIAHAGQTASSYGQADDTKRGIPLDTSMIVQDGAVTLAWEWGSAVGNGTIYSLGLTHSDVGDAGTGSTSQAFANMKPVINAREGLAWTHVESGQNNMILFVGADGYGYRFSASGTTVTIYKIPFAYKETGLVAGSPFVDPAASLIETHTVTTQTNFAHNPYFCYVKSTNKLWLFYSTSNSTSVKVEEIDLSTWTATNRDISNLGASVGPFVNHTPLTVPYYNGSVYLRKAKASDSYYASTGLLRVNLASTADQSEMTAKVVPYGGVFIPTASGKILAGKAFVINNGVLYPCSFDDTYNAVGYDNISNYPFLDQKEGLANLGGQYDYRNNGQYYYVAASKFYLASKYNLPTPVSKQNGQSMVITYTLTEVS